jgi:hypothetical protein
MTAISVSLCELPHVFSNNVGLNIYLITNPTDVQISVFESKRDNGDVKTGPLAGIDGQTDPIHCHGALGDKERVKGGGNAKLKKGELPFFLDLDGGSDPVHMAGNEMTA